MAYLAVDVLQRSCSGQELKEPVRHLAVGGAPGGVTAVRFEAAGVIRGGSRGAGNYVSGRPRGVGERLRAIRQAKLDKRAARNLARAERLENLSDQEAAKIKPYDDWAFWTQPILIGHHSEKSHRNLRNRLDTAMTKSAAYYREAQELRAASTPAKARIAGDAESRRQLERDALDKIIKIGSRVMDFSFGAGTVVRIHKKSYTVKYDRGFQHSRDKSYFRPLKAA